MTNHFSIIENPPGVVLGNPTPGETYGWFCGCFDAGCDQTGAGFASAEAAAEAATAAGHPLATPDQYNQLRRKYPHRGMSGEPAVDNAFIAQWLADREEPPRLYVPGPMHDL